MVLLRFPILKIEKLPEKYWPLVKQMLDSLASGEIERAYSIKWCLNRQISDLFHYDMSEINLIFDLDQVDSFVYLTANKDYFEEYVALETPDWVQDVYTESCERHEKSQIIVDTFADYSNFVVQTKMLYLNLLAN